MGEITILDNIESLKEKLLDRADSMAEGAEWFPHLTQFVELTGGASRACDMAYYYSLSLLEDKWLDVPFDVRKEYGLNFSSFAEKLTGRAWGTIRNNIRAARKMRHFNPVVTIEVPKRDEAGKVLMANGHPVTEVVEWSATAPDMSKLVLVTPRLDQGLDRDRELLSLVMDPGAKVEDLRRAMYPKKEVVDDDGDVVQTSYSPYFSIEANVLVYNPLPGIQITIGELYWDMYEHSEYGEQGIRRLLSLIGIDLNKLDLSEVKYTKELYDYSDET